VIAAVSVGDAARELFAGTYLKAEKRAIRRARLLLRRLVVNGNCPPWKLKILKSVEVDAKSKLPA
jgi:hypothetical protein